MDAGRGRGASEQAEEEGAPGPEALTLAGWRGWPERDWLPVVLPAALLLLAWAAYFLFVGVWLVSGMGLGEQGEWFLLVGGWALVPPLAIVAAFLSIRSLGLEAKADVGCGAWRLATFQGALALVASCALRVAEALEGSFATVCGVVAFSVPAVALAGVFWIRRTHETGASAGAPRGVFAAPLLLASALGVASVPHLPPFRLIALLVVLALGAIVTWLRLRDRSTGLSRLATVAVLGLLPLLILDLRLPFDASHHNWYLGTVNAVMHGRVLLGDVASAYGVMPILILKGIFEAHWFPMSYVGTSLFLTLLLIVQYGLVFVLLRSTLRSASLAIGALAVLLAIHLGSLENPLTWYPSAGPLRFGLPYLLPCLLVLRQRVPRVSAVAWLGEGAVVGIASLWDSQTLLSTLAVWGALVAYETAFASRRSPRWWRGAVARVGWAVLCMVGVHLLFAFHTRSIFGDWPDWDFYREFVEAFSPVGGQGIALFAAPLWGGWLALAFVHLGSVVGCLVALPFIRSARGATRYAIVFAITAMGVAQMTYYIGWSVPSRMIHISLPAIFVAAFWSERLTDRAMPLAFRRSCGIATAAVLLLCLLPAAHRIEAWVGRSALASIAQVAQGQSAPAPVGCESLLACLAFQKPIQRQTRNALVLIRDHAPDAERLPVFSTANTTVEVLLFARKTHVFPLTDPSENNVVPAAADRIAAADHGLAAGDVIFVDRPALDFRKRIVPGSNQLDGEQLVLRLLDQLCDEFECVEVAKRGRITAEQLRVR